MRTAIALGARWITLIAAQTLTLPDNTTDEAAPLRVRVQPYNETILTAARAGMASVLGDTPFEAADADLKTRAMRQFGEDMAVAAIDDWQGAGDGDGAVIDGPPTPDQIRLLMADPWCYNAFYSQYVTPYLARSVEKNASSRSSDAGTASAAANTAPTVLN